jgi:hypothetical protein
LKLVAEDDEEQQQNALATERTPMLPSTKGKPNKAEPTTNDSATKSTLSASDYSGIRLQPWLQEHKSYLSTLRSHRGLLNMLVKIVTLSSVGAAALAEQWLVPMLIVLATAFNRVAHASSIVVRIAVIEKSVSDIEAVIVWWSGMREDQQEEGATKTRLVEQSEQIMIESKILKRKRRGLVSS